ncbi:hypothetical protein [Allisonella histaminiformans]|uniref:hypothetical protein n=1 Tax=Allisonella histaminiformans TaxID=209880 RepID=UPI0022E1656D|nr:hypothetical protein [Allisonella histaminiformans]
MANPGDWLIPAGLEMEIWGEIIMQAMPDAECTDSEAAERLESLAWKRVAEFWEIHL